MASEIVANYTALLKRMPPVSDMVDRLIRRTDGDGSGSISSAEFAAGLQSVPGTGLTEKGISSLFNDIDADGNGTASKEELGSYIDGLANSVRSAMLDAQETASQSPASRNDRGTPDPRDTNKDGTVSLMEMLSGTVDNAKQQDGGMDALLEQVKSAMVSRVYRSMQERPSAGLSGALGTAA